uniref:Uncharacterized protein n=1 Tax=Cacopsylla melanoneura TaxID=428564 RepID=A0A8D8TL84_9HEMI
MKKKLLTSLDPSFLFMLIFIMKMDAHLEKQMLTLKHMQMPWKQCPRIGKTCKTDTLNSSSTHPVQEEEVVGGLVMEAGLEVGVMGLCLIGGKAEEGVLVEVTLIIEITINDH